VSDADFYILNNTIYSNDTAKQDRNMNYFGTAQLNLIIRRHIHVSYTSEKAEFGVCNRKIFLQ